MSAIRSRRRARNPPPPDYLAGAADRIERALAVRVDPEKAMGLGMDGWELLRLIDAAKVGSGLNMSQLDDDERSALEGLIERAAGDVGLFERRRKADEMGIELRDLARRALRRPLTADQEAGLLREIWKQITANALRPEHVAVLVFVLAALHSGETIAPGSSVEKKGDENVLRFDRRMGLLGTAAGERGVGDVTAVLEHLARNSWIKLDGRAVVTVRLGVRASKALRTQEPS